MYGESVRRKRMSPNRPHADIPFHPFCKSSSPAAQGFANANSPWPSFIRFVHGVQQERIAFRIRKDPASARWCEPELGSNSQHYFCLTIYGREVWRLNRKSFGRFDHRAVFLNHLDSLNPQSIGDTISRERPTIE